MNDSTTLIAVKFDEPLLAQEMLLAFARLVKRRLVDTEDAAFESTPHAKARLGRIEKPIRGQPALDLCFPQLP